MANVHPMATMCEVTYDSDWYDDDRFMTPYRYSLMRNDTESNSDTVSLTLPSYTYYEYLRSLYDCRSTALHRNPPGYPPSGGSERLPDRAKTWHEFGSERTSVQASRQAAHSEPVKIRPTYPFPTLHLIQQGATSGDESEDEDYTDRSKEKLVWVDALNKWIPEHQLHPRPYMSFIGNPPVIEKQGGMKLSRETSDKRDEVRRRAQEIAEQRKQRKAYSTPLYTSLTERKQKARIQSSKAPASTPASPVQKTVKAPPPKEVWQPKDTPRSGLEEKPPPVKKEISITLLTSKTEETESKAAGDTGATPRDKHVKFQQTTKAVKDKKKKEDDETENRNNNNKVSADAIAAEKRLIEALEKQRLQQLAEEKRLLEEQQREKERLAREKEMQAEKERMKKEREKLLQLEKDPKKHGLMNSHKQHHENYYESTMTAAGYYPNAGSPQDNSKERSDIPAGLIRNRNLNRGVLKPKEPIKHSTDKVDKPDKNSVNLAKSKVEKKTIDTVNTQKSVPGGTSYVPSKESNVKKNNSNKTQLDSNKKEPVKKKEEPVISNMVKEDSFSETGGKKRKGKGEGTKLQKKKGGKDKNKKKIEDEEEEYQTKQSPEIPVEKKPEPVVTAPQPVPEKSNSKTIDKKIKQGHKRVKGGQSKSVKPMLAGMSNSPKPASAPSPARRSSAAEEKLQVSSSEELIQEPPKRQLKQQSGESNSAQKPDESEIPQERRKSVFQHVKEQKGLKEKKERPCAKKGSKEKELENLPPLPTEAKKSESWIFDEDDFSEKIEIKQEEEVDASTDLVQDITADLQPEIIEAEKKKAKEKRIKSVIENKFKTENIAKKWRKPPKDSSYDDEMRRLELAEERRKRQMEMLERIRNRQIEQLDGEGDDGSPKFEDYGFLAKYCIFTKGNIEMYRHAFDAVDDEHKGWLEGQDVMIALRGVNSKLTEAEEEYMYRILELTGYKLTNGADFKMFSVLAALSQRISALDAWMRNLIGKMDFKMLEMKMFMCKTLWECNVDPDTNKISLDQLCVDLRAGGVSFEHELEVREKLSHLDALDLLDFLTYIPLFIMIHESVVKNPLDDRREK